MIARPRAEEMTTPELRPRVRLALALLAMLTGVGALPASARGQAPVRTLDLGSPLATLEDRFSAVRGVRELSAGGLLVADWIEEAVFWVDLDTGAAELRVTTGEGPGEVRLPTGLVALNGDSTLLADAGNGRLSVLGPDGRVARTVRADQRGLLGVRGTDADGGYLFAVPAWAEPSPLPDDSVRVASWNPTDREMRAVLTVQGARARRDQSPSRELRLPVVGFAASDGWTVAPDGSIVVVRGRDYRVEYWTSEGRRASGPSYEYSARPVTAADRRGFVERFMAESLMSGRDSGSGLGHAPSLDASELERLVARTEFADSHPLFTADRVLSSPGGQTWVGLGTGEEQAYDVFDSTGVRVGRVHLGEDRFIALVGDRGVYVVRTGALGLQSIELYRLPS